MVTLKLDGLFFVLGGLTGIFLFGETVDLFWEWWNNSYAGRLTLPGWLNLPVGVVVLGIVLMALFMFWGSEQLERIFGKRDLKKEPRLRRVGALALFLGALAVFFMGTPSNIEKWARIAPEKEPLVSERQVQIHPAELLNTMADDRLKTVLLDVRPENDYNLFHIEGAQRVDPEDLVALSSDLLAEAANNKVIVVMSNDENAATEAWKILTAESIPNVYILEGGINNWLATFAVDESEIVPTPVPSGNDTLAFTFPSALGSRYLASFPSAHEWDLEFTPRIKLQIQRDKSGGGCG
jgi:hypothetical protein